MAGQTQNSEKTTSQHSTMDRRDVVLAWFDDTLGTIGNLHSGWALWNFRGPFGVLDTERKGTKYEDWHGHALDRALLALLQKKMAA